MGVQPNVNNITNAAKLIWSPGSSRETQVINNIGNVTVFLGGSTVTTSTGLPFPPDSEVTLVANGGAVYAIAAAGAQGALSLAVGLQ